MLPIWESANPEAAAYIVTVSGGLLALLGVSGTPMISPVLPFRKKPGGYAPNLISMALLSTPWDSLAVTVIGGSR